MIRRKSFLILLVCFTLLALMGTVAAFETSRGTDIDFSATYWSVWETDEENDVKVTFEVNEFGDGVRDVHDIVLRVRVDFATKTYEDSEGTWTIDDEGDSIIYTFEFYVDSDDVTAGETGDVYIRAEFRENVAFATDPEYDTGWGDVGEVEIESPPLVAPPPGDSPEDGDDDSSTPIINDDEPEGFCLGTIAVVAIPITAAIILKKKK